MLQFVDDFLLDSQRIHNHPVLFKFHEVESAEGSSILVLQAAFDLQFVAFDPVCGARRLVVGHREVQELLHQAYQAHHQSGGGTQAGTSRRFAVQEQVKARGSVAAQTLDSSFDQIELAVINGIGLGVVVYDVTQVAGLYVDQTILASSQGSPYVTADRRVEDATAFLLKKLLNVGAPSGKADTQGSFGSNQHAVNLAASSAFARW